MKTLVIGAGMAGLSAARAIHDAGHDVAVIEAKDHLGGRTFTNTDIANIPVEFGAEFVHGSKVITWNLIREAGLNTAQWHKRADALVQLEPSHVREHDTTTMQGAQRRFADFAVTRSWHLPDEPAQTGESWHDYLSRIGFTDSQMRYVERSFANAVSDSSDRFDAEEALASALDDTDGEGDFRILEGYKTLVNFVADGLDVRLGQPVTRIDWQSNSVTVQTQQDTFSADNIIIAVPLGVLKAGSMRFAPALPAGKLEALSQLRMGIVIKLVYVFAEAILPDTTSAVYSRKNPPMWWTSNYGRAPQQEQVWTAFASGDWARELLANAHEHGTDTMMMEALASLEQATHQTLPKPTTMRLVNWLADPYTQGGYSYAAPGHASARQGLAQATPPLFWSGEATAPWHQTATVHGAIVSGRRAAQEVLASHTAEVCGGVMKVVSVDKRHERKKALNPKDTEPKNTKSANIDPNGARVTWFARLLLVPIYVYRRVISPLTPPTCRFHPTCSQYAVTAIRTHGALRGGWLAIKRVARCHPWHPGGVDPVPPRNTPKSDA